MDSVRFYHEKLFETSDKKVTLGEIVLILTNVNNLTKTMKKTLLITLLGASLALAGCAQQAPAQDQNLNQPTANVNQNVNQPLVNQNQNLNVSQPAVNLNQNVNTNQPAEPTADWQTYRNNQYSFEFKYLKEWPKPTMSSGVFTGGFPKEKSNWVLNIGIVGQGPCEGADCSQYLLEGYNDLDYNSALASLKKDEFISNLVEKNVNGYKVILFTESGLSTYPTALFFGPDKTLKFRNIWGDKKYFDQIISTLKLR